MKLSQIKTNPNNPRIIRDEKFEKLKKSIQDFPQMMELRPIIVDESGTILGGNMRYQAIKSLKMAEVPDEWVKRVEELTEDQKKEFIVKDNVGFGDWDWDLIANEWDALPLNAWGLDVPGFDLTETESDKTGEEETKVTLADRFLVPPFSVLDARQGYWQDRKRAWLALGIESELGRGENLQGLSDSNDEYRYNKQAWFDRKKSNGLLGFSEQARSHYKTGNGKSPARCFGQDLMRGEHTLGAITAHKTEAKGVLGHPETTGDISFYSKKRAKEAEIGREIELSEFLEKYYTPTGKDTQSGTSIFDPVLCEIAYRWFTGEDFTILDPFAGGSVRGVVASRLNRNYVGVELRKEQIEANKTQAERLCKENKPVWINGDSRHITEIATGEYDFIFSCPPYADLEVYSDDPQDLSTLPYEKFREDYKQIIKQSVSMLKNNRFACFVVGEVRSKKGEYYNFIGDTIQAFIDAGVKYYNEAILVTSVGSLPIRVGRQFDAGRKLGKTHQNVLVFIKGDAKKATTDCGKVDVIALSELPNSLVGD